MLLGNSCRPLLEILRVPVFEAVLSWLSVVRLWSVAGLGCERLGVDLDFGFEASFPIFGVY